MMNLTSKITHPHFAFSSRVRILFPLLIMISLFGISGGCGLFDGVLSPPSEGPDSYLLGTVPFYPQDTFQSAPAVVAMVLAWSGESVMTKEIETEILQLSSNDRFQDSIIATAYRHGRITYTLPEKNALLMEIAAGNPVIVLQNFGVHGYPVWKYSVVIGYDANQEIIALHSGVKREKWLSFEEFEQYWAKTRHWGVLMLRPGQIPATAVEKTYLDAVLGLEKTGKWEKAIQGYQVALQKWPDSLEARMRLGNSFLAIDKLEEAKKYFREAIELYPNYGAAYDVLAQVFHLQGNLPEAIRILEQAIELHDPLQKVYKKKSGRLKRELKRQPKDE